MNILYLVRERFPSFRPDVTELFGTELPRHGVRCVAVMRSERHAQTTTVRRMARCAVVVTPFYARGGLVGKLINCVYLVMGYATFLSLAWRRSWDIIQCRDEIGGAWLVKLASLFGTSIKSYWLSFPFPESSMEEASRSRGLKKRVLQFRGWLGVWLLYRTGLRLVDHVFVQSEQMKRDVAHYGIAPSKMTSVPMGVQIKAEDIDKYSSLRPRPERLVVSYLGTLTTGRRLDFMVRVIAEVRKVVPDAGLLLVGAAESREERSLIFDEADRLGVSEAITITGFLPRAAAWDKLRESFVCVSPFFPMFILNSTSPTKLVEYMALGMPVLANEHPEQSLLIEDSGTGKCVAWDESAFAMAIISMWRDADETLRNATRGPAYVLENRSYRAIGARVYDRYKSLLRSESERSLAA
ncbi:MULTISPECIES: glycosyltransferase [unclassified Methylibium]|uniref:glycosyltransferase n=1 Tax=unclassified Methylibium TaxID=2633235 RepID=UPI0009DFF7BC|nr:MULTISPECIES: glycosyltransferase [unclassified Methylibium]